jgi:hypothetical protein
MANGSGLTAEDIRVTVGRLSDESVAEILATGATVEELVEAFSWLNEDDQLGRELLHRPSPTVQRLCEILQAEEPEPEDERGVASSAQD